MNYGKLRPGIFAVVAAYLLYISYELFQGRADTETSMTPLARWFFIALFVIASVFLLIYAYRVWKDSERREEERQSSGDDSQLK